MHARKQTKSAPALASAIPTQTSASPLSDAFAKVLGKADKSANLDALRERPGARAGTDNQTVRRNAPTVRNEIPRSGHR